MRLRTPKLHVRHGAHLFITGEVVVVLVDAIERMHVLILLGCLVVTIIIHQPFVVDALKRMIETLEAD